MNNVKIPSLFVETADKDKIITFECTENCSGEVLIAELYETAPESIGGITALATVSSGSDVGKDKGEEVDMDLDFTGVDSGAYYCKIYTEETGVIAKLIVRIQ